MALLDPRAKDPAQVPEEIAYMVGEDGVERALRRIRELADARGVSVAVVAVTNPPPRAVTKPHDDPSIREADSALEAVAAAVGLPVLCTMPGVLGHLQENGLQVFDVINSMDDRHPDPLGHRRIAEAIETGLVEHALLPPDPSVAEVRRADR